MKKEIGQRRVEIEAEDETIASIYFGGGTPSVLKVSEIDEILNVIAANYLLAEDMEITIEANPDDLTPSFLTDLIHTPVNRLSVGIQSFNDRDLKGMNRRHNSEQALDSIRHAQETGFNNISIDLIYGLPNQSLHDWKANLDKAIALDVQHISAYHLTYHKGTVFYDYLKAGKIKELPDELSYEQFKLLKSRLERDGFEHYEISNFAKGGLYSRHNTAYWTRKNYLGFGPSAHSFDQKTRRWNVSGLKQYIEALEREYIYWQEETLTPQDQYNDFIITSLRTKWGINEEILNLDFKNEYADHFKKEIRSFVDSGHVIFINGGWKLSTKGLFISDKIMENLIAVS